MQKLVFNITSFYSISGQPPECGHLHPLLKVRSEFREIFLEMGFTEMPTNQYVESSFWNFDALFQPQQHPARDAHDTFFISSPSLSKEFPMDYLERVKTVHSKGGYGSQVRYFFINLSCIFMDYFCQISSTYTFKFSIQYCLLSKHNTLLCINIFKYISLNYFLMC